MRMSQPLFNDIKSHIDSTIDNVGGWDNVILKYETGQFFNADKVKNLQVRFMWDIYNLTQALYLFSTRVLNENLDDSHIETALKRICPKVTRKY